MGIDSTEHKLPCGCTEIEIEYEIFVRIFIVPSLKCSMHCNEMKKSSNNVYITDMPNEEKDKNKWLAKLVHKFKNEFGIKKFEKFYKVKEGYDLQEWIENAYPHSD